jgi:hypothetical protein
MGYRNGKYHNDGDDNKNKTGKVTSYKRSHNSHARLAKVCANAYPDPSGLC